MEKKIEENGKWMNRSKKLLPSQEKLQKLLWECYRNLSENEKVVKGN